MRKLIEIFKNAFLNILVGVPCIFFGATTIIGDGDYAYYGFRGGSGPQYGFPVDRKLGYLFILLGIAMIVVAFFPKRDTKMNFDHDRICANCRAVYSSMHIDTVVCPKCSGKLENIVGLLKRKPKFFKGRP